MLPTLYLLCLFSHSGQDIEFPGGVPRVIFFECAPFSQPYQISASPQISCRTYLLFTPCVSGPGRYGKTWHRPLNWKSFTSYIVVADRHHTHTHTRLMPFVRTIRVSRYQKRKTNLVFTEPRYSEWQWNSLGHMQVCTSLQTDNHASTPPATTQFLQAGCSSCRPTNSIKALSIL